MPCIYLSIYTFYLYMWQLVGEVDSIMVEDIHMMCHEGEDILVGGERMHRIRQERVDKIRQG
jgi:hypothetical protein